jgi:methyl coenzyme M reductase alpha subunit
MQLNPGVGVGVGTKKCIVSNVLNGGGVAEVDVVQGVANTVVLQIVDSIRLTFIGISSVKQLISVP